MFNWLAGSVKHLCRFNRGIASVAQRIRHPVTGWLADYCPLLGYLSGWSYVMMVGVNRPLFVIPVLRIGCEA